MSTAELEQFVDEIETKPEDVFAAYRMVVNPKTNEVYQCVAREVVKLSKLTLDVRLQPRIGTCEITAQTYVDIYVNDKSPFPPISAFRDKDNPDILWLVDGFHRVMAAKMIGLKEIPCFIYEGAFEDAMVFAIAANTHPLSKPLTPDDKAKAMDMLFRSLPDARKWKCGRLAQYISYSHASLRVKRREWCVKNGLKFPENRKPFAPISASAAVVKSDGKVCMPPVPFVVDGKITRKVGTVYIGPVGKESTKEKIDAYVDKYNQAVSHAARSQWRISRRDFGGFRNRLMEATGITVAIVEPSGFNVTSCKLVRCGNFLVAAIESSPAERDEYWSIAAMCLALKADVVFVSEPHRVAIVGYFNPHPAYVHVRLFITERLGVEFLTPEELVKQIVPPRFP